MRFRSLSRAFTLIELLVVIAIISILAAILFPVFAQAKDSAKQTQCIMHMRQIGIALSMYADDHEGFWAPVVNLTQVPGFPPQQPWIGYDTRNAGIISGYYGDMTKAATQAPIPGKIDGYLKNEAVKKCPKAPQGWQLALAYNGWPSGKNNVLWYGSSAYWSTNPKAVNQEYGPGFKDLEYVNGLFTASGANDGEIEEPSNTLTLWEHGAWVPTCNFLFAYNWFNGPPAYDQGLKAHFQFLHREAAVVVFADSHVKRQPYGGLKRPMFSVRKDIYN